jgi:hypothetical protein
MSADFDSLVPDPVVRREFNITSMTMFRWDNNPARIAEGWPPKIKIGRCNFRSRSALETFKATLVQRAIAARGIGTAAEKAATA